MLTPQKYMSFTLNTLQDYDVPEEDRISVKPGLFIGHHSVDSNTPRPLSYATQNTSDVTDVNYIHMPGVYYDSDLPVNKFFPHVASSIALNVKYGMPIFPTIKIFEVSGNTLFILSKVFSKQPYTKLPFKGIQQTTLLQITKHYNNLHFGSF